MRKRSLFTVITALLLSVMIGCGPAVTSGSIQQGSGSITFTSPSSSSQSSNGETPSVSDPHLSSSSLSQSTVPSQSSSSSSSVVSPSSIVSSAPSSAPSSSSAPVSVTPSSSSSSSSVAPTPEENEEVRAVWISYIQLGNLLLGCSEAQFRTNMANAYDKISEMGLNTVFVHVRPFGDAVYDSDIFPTSYLISGKEGDPLEFDPLTIMIEEAHKRGLSFEAWINPYRIRNAVNKKGLSSDNIAAKLLANNDDAVISYAGLVSYNPGSATARQLITDGVVEIVRNYDVDGIHFDDYFYPVVDAAFDDDTYSEYKNGGGTLSLAEWRRENVNILLRQVYSAIKSEKEDVLFGISPQGNMNNNYTQMFIDVEKWLSNEGYLDYICPQVYYGFNNSACPFEKTLASFDSMIKVPGIKLYVGLAAYKIGTVDNYAGSGKNEWINNSDMLARMVTAARKNQKYSGFSIYSYDSIFAPAASVKAQVAKEAAALEKVLVS